MNLDKYGLPVQADGDANDQLQRASILVSALLAFDDPPINDCTKTELLCGKALSPEGALQPILGLWARYTNAPLYSTSADQIVAALAAHVVAKSTKTILTTFGYTMLRFGFAQNYRNTLNGTKALQIPDFMLLRAAPLFARAHKILYPIALITDVLLLLAAAASVGPVWKDGKGFAKRSMDDVDDNVIVLTLIACNAAMPTLFSRLAAKIYAKYRPSNFGNVGTGIHPVIGAMVWYHRAESGGNPEIAQAIIPAINAYILK